jgi:nucleoid-associated protein YgaU
MRSDITKKPARIGQRMLSLALAAVMCLALPITASAETFRYEHDPRLNSKAMVDIQYDPDAVYGFVPREDSTRIAMAREIDFTNAEEVNTYKQKRREYHDSFEEMYNTWIKMEAEGKSEEEIARVISPMRNQIRLATYTTEEGLKAVKESNLNTYGQEDGPTADQLYEKYGSWETVLLKSFGSNSGMDACLGLYDDEYEFNLRTGAVAESNKAMYKVQQGDSLSLIATYYLGDDTGWYTIYKANSDQISNADLIYEGQELYIPID